MASKREARSLGTFHFFSLFIGRTNVIINVYDNNFIDILIEKKLT